MCVLFVGMLFHHSLLSAWKKWYYYFLANKSINLINNMLDFFENAAIINLWNIWRLCFFRMCVCVTELISIFHSVEFPYGRFLYATAYIHLLIHSHTQTHQCRIFNERIVLSQLVTWWKIRWHAMAMNGIRNRSATYAKTCIHSTSDFLVFFFVFQLVSKMPCGEECHPYVVVLYILQASHSIHSIFVYF